MTEQTASGGTVGRAHGLDGSFYVVAPTPVLAHDTLVVDGEPRRVVRRAGTAQRPILRLDGVDDRAGAQALRGQDLLGPRPPLDDDEYSAEDLAGCAVVDGDQIVGTVARMLALPSCEVLEVWRGPDLPDLLVPLVRDAIRQIDIEARRIDVRLEFLGEAAASEAR